MGSAGIYVRISRDLTGSGLGVARQEEDCRAECDRRGWPIHEVYIDNDLSAYSGKTRPAYDRLLADIDAGVIDSLVIWHPDRLHRSPAELEGFITLVERTRLTVATCRAGEYDLTTAAGRMTARVVGAVARNESEQKSERNRRRHLQLATFGGANGGPRPFGYVTGNGPLEPTEAALIADAVGRVVAGDSISGITLAWNETGIRTPRGSVWGRTSVRRVLLSGRIAGLREHHGEIVGPAGWPAIVDRGTWELCRARLNARKTGVAVARSRLLAGFLICSKCGGRLRARRDTYCCKACYGVQVMAGHVDRMIGIQVVALLADGLPPLDLSDGQSVIARQIEQVEAQIQEWDTDRAAGVVNRARWLSATADLTARLTALERQYVELRPAVRSVQAVNLDEWETLTLDRRRAVLGELVEQIVVHPSTTPGRFDPNRVEVRWLH